MVLTSPIILIALTALPVLWLLSRHARRRIIATVPSTRLWERVLASLPAAKVRRLDLWLLMLLLALLLGIVGAAGPALEASVEAEPNQDPIGSTPKVAVMESATDGRWLFIRVATDVVNHAILLTPVTRDGQPAGEPLVPNFSPDGGWLVELPTGERDWILTVEGEPVHGVWQVAPVVLRHGNGVGLRQFEALSEALCVSTEEADNAPNVWLLGPGELNQQLEVRSLAVEPAAVSAVEIETQPSWIELAGDPAFQAAVLRAGGMQVSPGGMPLVTTVDAEGGRRCVVQLDRGGSRVTTSLQLWGESSGASWLPLFVANAIRELTGRDVIAEPAWSVSTRPDRSEREPVVGFAGPPVLGQSPGLYRTGVVNPKPVIGGSGLDRSELTRSGAQVTRLGWLPILAGLILLGLAVADSCWRLLRQP